jgi:serine/threonine protein kinase
VRSFRTVPERFGDYVVYERLGAGGMATVHRAVLTGMAGFKRPVALKRLLPSLAHDENFVRAFIREARLAANLRHVNIAQTYDLGIVDDTYFIAMELCEGKDLREVLKQSAVFGEPMPPAILVAVLMQVCEALDYAHNLRDETGTPFGIVHRDVSPSNIIVGLDGAAKLIDFGIAKATSSSLMTMSGQLKGKFAYIAPETLGGVFDARADLFSLGICAYELLTAAPLFTGNDDLDTLRRIREMPVPPPSYLRKGIPAEVDDVVMTALVRNPDERWQSASAMRGALGVLSSRKNLRATNGDVVYWLEWLFGLGARPSQKQPTVDEPDILMDGQASTDEHLLVPSSSETRIERPTPRPGEERRPPASSVPTWGVPARNAGPRLHRFRPRGVPHKRRRRRIG